MSIDEIQERRNELVRVTEQLNQELSAVGLKNWEETLTSLALRVGSDTFKLLVIGEFRRGKSTFINALLSQEVLPAYAVPTTAVVIEVKWNDTPRARLFYKSDNTGFTPEPLDVSVDELTDYVTIKTDGDLGHSNQESPYAKAEVYWPLELCRRGVELIDSPGLNEHEIRQEATFRYLDNADAILFVIACDSPVSLSEQDALDNLIDIKGYKRIFFICNRIDLIREREQPRVREYLMAKLRDRTELGARGVFFISAREALEARISDDKERFRRSGIEGLEGELEHYLKTERGRGKIVQPAQQLKSAIREGRRWIKEREDLLRTDLDEVIRRANQANNQLELLEKQRRNIVTSVERAVSAICNEVRESTYRFYRDIGDRLPTWTDEYKPQMSVGITGAIFSAKKKEQFVTEITEHLSKRIEAANDEWQKTTLQPLLEGRLNALAEELDEKTRRFGKDLASVRVELTTGVSNLSQAMVEEQQLTLTERIVAAIIGGLFLNPVAAGVGAAMGYKEMAKSLLPQLAIAIAATALGVTNPLIIIGLMIAAALGQGFLKAGEIDNKLKKAVGENYRAKLVQESYQRASESADELNKRLTTMRNLIDSELGKELQSVRSQAQAAVEAKQSGKAHVDRQLVNLRNSATVLDQFDIEIDEILIRLG